MNSYKRIPKHIGIIPDGNRRWAKNNGLYAQDGYSNGVQPGFRLYELMLDAGIQEATFYGFTNDNTKRPKVQQDAFCKACVNAVEMLSNRDADLMVIGKTESSVFPKPLLKYANKRVKFGKDLIKLNFLVNYDWKWDIGVALEDKSKTNKKGTKNNLQANIASSSISRIDMIIRWGGRRRLSGFLPIQSVYSDIYIIDDYWPDFKDEHFYNALEWYQTTDITLGG